MCVYFLIWRLPLRHLLLPMFLGALDIISTTFSARTSLNASDVEYDYVIMDEASQVDISTGSLALSCAKHAVIVGDLKQLPNVVDNDTHKKADLIREKYSLGDAYDFANKSFLQSVVEAVPNVPQTLLREHYRCHPRIISFCNQKFYNNDLVIMTEDDELNKSLMAIKTAEGNHRRGNYNQRQIDIIKEEILPKLDVPSEEIGIIAPYNDQVDERGKVVKQNIIDSIVDDEQIEGAIIRNRNKFNISKNDYDKNVESLREWLKNRNEWMQEFYAGKLKTLP